LVGISSTGNLFINNSTTSFSPMLFNAHTIAGTDTYEASWIDVACSYNSTSGKYRWLVISRNNSKAIYFDEVTSGTPTFTVCSVPNYI